MKEIRLAIVGSRELEGSEKAKRLIEEVLDRFNPDVVISGGARGIDRMAAEAAEKRGISIIEYLPTRYRWWGTDGFEARNKEIAKDCTVLVSIRSKISQTYGAGWTADYAEKLGRKVVRYEI